MAEEEIATLSTEDSAQGALNHVGDEHREAHMAARQPPGKCVSDMHHRMCAEVPMIQGQLRKVTTICRVPAYVITACSC